MKTAKIKKVDFSKYKFRCSSLGTLMTGNLGLSDSQQTELNKLDDKIKAGGSLTEIQKGTYAKLIKLRDWQKDDLDLNKVLSKTTRTKLIEIYNAERFNRRKEINSKYIEKGLAVEEDSITLLTRLEFQTNGILLKKNEERLTNRFITGEVDLFEGESIKKADRVTDIKSKWDLFTFSSTFDEPIDPSHKAQLNGYMDLTGAKKARISNCLVNTPEKLINDAKRRLLFDMDCLTDEDPNYIEACKELERNMVFDDIPLAEREFSVNIERDNKFIKDMHARVPLWRQFLMEYHAKRLNYAITRKWQSYEEIVQAQES